MVLMYYIQWDLIHLGYLEQYAIKTGRHPKETTEINIKRFKDQLDNLGLSYDWSREIKTSDSDYYKWTQWIFLKNYIIHILIKKQKKQKIFLS